jgi:hypothetical protein
MVGAPASVCGNHSARFDRNKANGKAQKNGLNVFTVSRAVVHARQKALGKDGIQFNVENGGDWGVAEMTREQSD